MAEVHEMAAVRRDGTVKQGDSQTREVVAVSLDRDTLVLARTGKKQVLKVSIAQNSQRQLFLRQYLTGRSVVSVF